MMSKMINLQKSPNKGEQDDHPFSNLSKHFIPMNREARNGSARFTIITNKIPEDEPTRMEATALSSPIWKEKLRVNITLSKENEPRSSGIRSFQR